MAKPATKKPARKSAATPKPKSVEEMNQHYLDTYGNKRPPKTLIKK